MSFNINAIRSTRRLYIFILPPYPLHTCPLPFDTRNLTGHSLHYCARLISRSLEQDLVLIIPSERKIEGKTKKKRFPSSCCELELKTRPHYLSQQRSATLPLVRAIIIQPKRNGLNTNRGLCAGKAREEACQVQ